MYRHSLYATWQRICLAAIGSALISVACRGDDGAEDGPYEPDPPVGATSFVSAAVDGLGPDRESQFEDDEFGNDPTVESQFNMDLRGDVLPRPDGADAPPVHRLLPHGDTATAAICLIQHG